MQRTLTNRDKLAAFFVAQDIVLNVTVPMTAGALLYIFAPVFPAFINNYLADGFWAYSFISLILIIWQRRVNPFWTLITFLSAAFFEIGQFLHIIAGTGDIADIAVYFLSFAIALILNKYFKPRYTNQFL